VAADPVFPNQMQLVGGQIQPASRAKVTLPNMPERCERRSLSGNPGMTPHRESGFKCSVTRRKPIQKLPGPKVK